MSGDGFYKKTFYVISIYLSTGEDIRDVNKIIAKALNYPAPGEH